MTKTMRQKKAGQTRLPGAMRKLATRTMLLAFVVTVTKDVCAQQEFAEDADLDVFLQKLVNKQVIPGTFEESGDHDLVFVPKEQKELAIPVSNQFQIPQVLEGVPVVVAVSPGDNNVTVDAATLNLQLMRTWEENRSALSKGQYQGVLSEFGRLESLLQEMLAVDTAGARHSEEFSRQIKSTEDAIVGAYLGLDTDQQSEERRALVNLSSDVFRVGKAVYGRSNNFAPISYQRIFENSRGAVALAEKVNGKYVCSGVLIGRRLVLTALHCIEEYFPSDLKVVFNYEIDLDGEPLAKDEYEVEGWFAKGGPVAETEQRRLDFAVINVKPRGTTSVPESVVGSAEAVSVVPGDRWPKQCLSLAAPRRDDPVYIVGHPEGSPRTVHDNAYVMFPFKVNEYEFGRLQLLVEQEVMKDPDAAEKVAAFRSSYVRRIEGSEVVYEQFSRRWRSQPTIAAEADTFHGDSGGPVFGRQGHTIVGILFDGEDDVQDAWSPGWRRHEAILPVSEIVEQLDSLYAGWERDNDVCVHR